MPTFLTTEEVARQLRVGGKNPNSKKGVGNPYAVLARYRKDGLPCYRFGTSKIARILYTQEDLDKWVSTLRVC